MMEYYINDEIFTVKGVATCLIPPSVILNYLTSYRVTAVPDQYFFIMHHNTCLLSLSQNHTAADLVAIAF